MLAQAQGDAIRGVGLQAHHQHGLALAAEFEYPQHMMLDKIVGKQGREKTLS